MFLFHTGPRMPLDVHSSLKMSEVHLRMSIVRHSWLGLELELRPE